MQPVIVSSTHLTPYLLSLDSELDLDLVYGLVTRHVFASELRIMGIK